MVFGALAGGGGKGYDIAFDSKTDSLSVLYFRIKSSPLLDINQGSEAELMDRLKKGRITAMVEVRQVNGKNGGPQYDIHLKTTSASQRELPAVRDILKGIINETTVEAAGNRVATISEEEVKGRPYRMIDFYLPGMLGFSLIGSAVFGVAFVLHLARNTGVKADVCHPGEKNIYRTGRKPGAGSVSVNHFNCIDLIRHHLLSFYTGPWCCNAFLNYWC